MSLEAWGDENPDDADYGSWSERATDAGWLDTADYSPGAVEILKERERQELVEGWSSAHDDAHNGGELAEAAASYASATVPLHRGLPVTWPFEANWWKPKDRRSDLIRAGALIAAEIDRLDRAAKE